MKTLLKLEELAQFLLAILLFSHLDYDWWLFPALLLLPDISMLGYIFSTKTGALFYNIFHHKFLAIGILILGLSLSNQTIALIGIILFAHSAMDRVFGYGLKFSDHFKNTHLGWIGKK